ncbi:DNA-directed RNA polymerase [Candidatus Woesearchaeota archaeon]|nr:DNA-directed RNA polymerase [Candidatus Woesearchaeota archaeon]
MNNFRQGGFRNNNSNSNNNFGPREMHKATCSECGNECEVPFKPTEGKPVFCRDCYRKRKPAY